MLQAAKLIDSLILLSAMMSLVPIAFLVLRVIGYVRSQRYARIASLIAVVGFGLVISTEVIALSDVVSKPSWAAVASSAITPFTRWPVLFFVASLFTVSIVTLCVELVGKWFWRLGLAVFGGLAAQLLLDRAWVLWVHEYQAISYATSVGYLLRWGGFGAVLCCLFYGAEWFFSSRRRLLYSGVAVASCSAFLVAAGVVFIVFRPVQQRVVAVLDDWDSLEFTVSPFNNQKVRFVSNWTRFTIENEAIRINSGAVAGTSDTAPAKNVWRPTRFELRRVDAPLSQLSRFVPFGVFPGSVVYKTERAWPTVAFRSPSRRCAVVPHAASPASANEISFFPPPGKLVRLTRSAPDRMEWPSALQQASRPRTVTIDFRGSAQEFGVRAAGRGIWSLFCYPVLSEKSAGSFVSVDDSSSGGHFSAQPVEFLGLSLHPGVVMSFGREGEHHEILFSASVTSLSAAAESLVLLPDSIAGGVSDVLIRGRGFLAVGTARRDLLVSDEASLSGEGFFFAPSGDRKLSIEGWSSRAVLNGELVSARVIDKFPVWFQEKAVYGVGFLVSNVVTFLWARRIHRRQRGGPDK